MSQAEISRTPPVAVRRMLRSEVGFGCPVKECGNPYLEYHHFDPPWEVEHHHDPARMIALCSTHHAKADAWTVQQVRDLKTVSPDRREVGGRFEWMRDDVLAVVGGNFYYETPTMIEFRGQPLIWFERDDERRLLLNVEMLSGSGQPRTSLVCNDWIIRGDPEDVESPPNGSRLRVKYLNGDEVSVRFREWADAETLRKVFPRALALGEALQFPLVTAEIGMIVGGTSIRFDPKASQLGGLQMTGNVASHCGVGLSFN